MRRNAFLFQVRVVISGRLRLLPYFGYHVLGYLVRFLLFLVALFLRLIHAPGMCHAISGGQFPAGFGAPRLLNILSPTAKLSRWNAIGKSNVPACFAFSASGIEAVQVAVQYEDRNSTPLHSSHIA